MAETTILPMEKVWEGSLMHTDTFRGSVLGGMGDSMRPSLYSKNDGLTYEVRLDACTHTHILVFT